MEIVTSFLGKTCKYRVIYESDNLHRKEQNYYSCKLLTENRLLAITRYRTIECISPAAHATMAVT